MNSKGFRLKHKGVEFGLYSFCSSTFSDFFPIENMYCF